MNTHYTYLVIDLASISIPLLWSFEREVHFVQYWKPLFISIAFTALIFVPWDAIFTSLGYWGFNEKYITGIYLFGLPVEELLFFICIPYASVFTHEALKYYLPGNPLEKYTKLISVVLLLLFSLLLLFNLNKLYTATATFLAIIELIVFGFWLRSKQLARIFFSYTIVLIPFFIVNGLLTGSFIPEEVVWYNDGENLGLRMGTIPVEDTIYAFALLVLTMQVYEYLKLRYKAAS